MQNQTIIQSITVGQNLQRTYTVGDEIDGRVVIEIKDTGTEFDGSIHSQYWLMDEDGHLIANIENMPVIVDFKMIAVDDSDETPNYEVSDDLPF
ncbi:hypothetical protein [Paenibacillus harenae]|uniref:DUF3892 domain-containing protein n=1 Tax=Paenibacillus harenae TaxID=306543 RepID=A0ABT9U3V0_PAEHA|nr:hypothetical protein [Paenibacillus harenae]MDQ0114322.1 hypothetical protein [Paenibacillus harenae]